MITTLLPGGLGAETFIPYAKGYGVTLTQQEAVDLKAAWKRAFPEMEKHLQPESEFTHFGDTKYRGENRLGFIRGNTDYCASCNVSFQSLGASCAKMALWESLLTHPYNMINFVHDEIIWELPDKGLKENTEVAEHLAKTMAASAQQFLPDVAIKAEPTLMRRWAKGDCERDPCGNIVPLEG